MARGHHYRPGEAHMGDRAMRQDGGRTLDYTYESNVAKEAKEKKRGGTAKKTVGMEGVKTRHRLDRPGRKRGGGIGADATPLSTAARVTQAIDHKTDGDDLQKG